MKMPSPFMIGHECTVLLPERTLSGLSAFGSPALDANSTSIILRPPTVCVL
jgi:hypothetical protein